MQRDRAASPQIQFAFIRPRAGDCKNTAVALHMPTWIQVQLGHFHTTQDFNQQAHTDPGWLPTKPAAVAL